MNEQSKPPFAKHRWYYLFLKIAVIAAAVILAVHYFL